MNDQTTTAYIIGIVVSLVFLLIAALISNGIKYEGGSNPKDPKKRKVCFWICLVLGIIVTAVVGFIIRGGIQIPSLQAKFTTALLIAMGIGLVLYILLGLVLSKIFKNGKLGHWF